MIPTRSPRWRYNAASLSTSEDFPAPGAPVMPTISARPVRGKDLLHQIGSCRRVVFDFRDSSRDRPRHRQPPPDLQSESVINLSESRAR
jgi:hypothetical protein